MRYMYDAIKFNSSERFDEINVFARDLFGGTQATNTSISRQPISGTTSWGDTYHGTLIHEVVLTHTKPGSQGEGWIVRVLSRGKLYSLTPPLAS